MIPSAEWNPCAIRTASCPVMPSATSRISWGVTAALSRLSSSIISASICSRPAVSTRTVRARARPAAAMPSFTSLTTSLAAGSPWTPTSICRPSVWSCSTAAGRYTSAATRNGAFCSCLSRRASLPAVVVLPEPCSPTSRMTVGGTVAWAIGASFSPSMATSSS